MSQQTRRLAPPQKSPEGLTKGIAGIARGAALMGVPASARNSAAPSACRSACRRDRMSAFKSEDITVKKIIVTVAMAVLAVGVQAEDKKELTPQQALMSSCNKEATGKKGEERKAFMKTCLADGKKRQQEVMKSCNAEAKGKTGDERKKFMAECLKK